MLCWGHAGSYGGIDPDAYTVLLQLVQHSAALALQAQARGSPVPHVSTLPPNIAKQ